MQVHVASGAALRPDEHSFTGPGTSQMAVVRMAQLCFFDSIAI